MTEILERQATPKLNIDVALARRASEGITIVECQSSLTQRVGVTMNYELPKDKHCG